MKTLVEIKKEISESKYSTYVYILYKPDGTPFYVGKGGWHRLAKHEEEASRENFLNLESNPHKLNTIRKIWREGNEVKYGIDSWHKTGESANSREMELIAKIGRRCKKEGPLTNLTAGGEGTLDLPEEIRERISQKLKQYFINNPEVIKNLQSKKNEWIENSPEEYAEAERRRLEICNSEEVRKAVSDTLKEYYKENPAVLEEMSERASRYFEENPEAVENARQNSINNKNADYIIKWLETAPEEVLQEKWKKHGEWLKEWHQTEEGKATTKIAAEKRNEKFRTEEHRQHMAEKTAKYIRENPEADKARREKVKQTKMPRIQERQKKLLEIQDKLFNDGKIRNKHEFISPKLLYDWIRRGLVLKEQVQDIKYDRKNKNVSDDQECKKISS